MSRRCGICWVEGGENVESQNDLTPGGEGQHTAHVTSQCLWVIVYYTCEAIY